MNNEALIEAKEVLYAFMREMNSWERKYHRLYHDTDYGTEKYAPAALQELQGIYNKYLTAKDRKTGRLAGPDVGYPPEFDPAQERIISSAIDKSRVIFETLWTHPSEPDFTEQHRFTLVHKSIGWLIDKKEHFSAYKNKWVNYQF